MYNSRLDFQADTIPQRVVTKQQNRSSYTQEKSDNIDIIDIIYNKLH